MLVSDDVERECLKTSNKESGTHTWQKGVLTQPHVHKVSSPVEEKKLGLREE